jgi:hypothetical protein
MVNAVKRMFKATIGPTEPMNVLVPEIGASVVVGLVVRVAEEAPVRDLALAEAT